MNIQYIYIIMFNGILTMRCVAVDSKYSGIYIYNVFFKKNMVTIEVEVSDMLRTSSIKCWVVSRNQNQIYVQ